MPTAEWNCIRGSFRQVYISKTFIKIEEVNLLPSSSHILVTTFLDFCHLRDFLFNVFCLQGKMGKTKWKINKLLPNILVTSAQKTTKNEITKMGANAQMLVLNPSSLARVLFNILNFENKHVDENCSKKLSLKCQVS